MPSEPQMSTYYTKHKRTETIHKNGPFKSTEYYNQALQEAHFINTIKP
jgi:hypothetical protein